MKLTDLTLFKSVATEGSLSMAAHALNLSQPNVSRTIRQLECHLKTRLLHRTGRGIELTESGYLLLAFAERTLDGFDHLQTDIQKVEGFTPSKLRIYIPRHTGRLLVPAIFRKFHEHLPDITLDILERQAFVLLIISMKR